MGHSRRLKQVLVFVTLLAAAAVAGCKRAGANLDDPTPACDKPLTPEQEAAFATAEKGWEKRAVPVHHVYERLGEVSFWGDDGNSLEAIASLCAVKERFAGKGPAAVNAPRETLREVLTEVRTRPLKGVLHAPPGWYREGIKVAGMTDDQIAMYIFEVMTTQGGGSAAYGFNVHGTKARADGTQNALVIFVGRVLEELKKVKGVDFEKPPFALVKPIITDMAAGKTTGAMWMRTPTAEERAEVTDAIARGPAQPRQR